MYFGGFRWLRYHESKYQKRFFNRDATSNNDTNAGSPDYREAEMFLKSRDTTLTEAMESPGCDRRLLFNTYRQFEYINRMLAGWKSLYRRHIRPHLRANNSATLLDIGFGGGDLPLALYHRAQKEGYKLQITAIDTDSRALDFVRQHREIPADVSFRCVDIDRLLKEQVRFDFVISNHVIHHLSSQQLTRLADQAEQLCRRRVIFNDLQRSYTAYLLFSCFIAPFFRRSYAGSDGRISIRRSYTRSELSAALPAQWTVYRKFPFRLIALFNHV